MKKAHHIDAEAQRAKLKQQHPNMPDDVIEQGIKQFNEMLDVIQDCIEQINLSLENAIKIGRNIDADPVIFSGMLSEKVTKRIVGFSLDLQKVAVSAYTDQKAELMIFKDLKNKGFFN